MQKQHNLINASHWCSESHRHYVLYASSKPVLLFLKQSVAELQRVNIDSIAFKRFYQPFAGLIYDTKTNIYYLIRDHFGLEPFYYTVITGEYSQLCFGSTLPDVLAHLENPTIDKEQVALVLTDICASSMEYSDRTFYKHVRRVTPGHALQMRLTPKYTLQHHAFWTLTPGTPFIHYATNADYDAHFESLLHEAVDVACQSNSNSIGLEFSGGLDTSVILTALHKTQLPASLFMHIGKNDDERRYGDQLLQELKSTYPVHYVNADDFDVIAVLDQCKQWFSGGAPYLFFMFAHNVHQAAKQQGCQILLSGFGGDECVSSHAPLRTYGPSVGYKQLWQELNSTTNNTSLSRRLRQWLQLMQPQLLYAVQCIKSQTSPLARKQAPVHYKPYHSLQERETDWLTGNLSYHVRMRIEYSAVVARQMGFQYRYPLLYPPLVEFCFALPPEQKRRQGQHRLLMRRYLAKRLRSGLFNAHKKCGDILPGTMPKCQNLYKSGQLKHIFQDLPFAEICDDIIKHNLVTVDRFFHIDLLRYMFK